MSSKSKSDGPISKAVPTTPRVAKSGKPGSLKSDADSPSPVTNSRLSIGRTSPRSVTSKPTVTRSTTRLSTPEKPQQRIFKPSELQAQLSAAQDDLRKAKEKFVLSEKEKNQALSELREARKQADDANEKLQEALGARIQAEDTSVIDKFSAIKLEQAGIEVANKEKEWKKELEAVRSQHAMDITALRTATEELQRAKQELAMVTDAKNQTLSHADDAAKIAELHAEKVEVLSAELVELKKLLESNVDNGKSENALVAELKIELGSLRQELEKAKTFEQDLVEKEKSYEKIVADLKMEMGTLKEELVKAKACEEGLLEKEKSYENVMNELKLEMSSMEEELRKAKSGEQDLIEKEKSYEKIVEDLKSELGFLEEELEKERGFKLELMDKEEYYNKVVFELESEIGSLKNELENAKSSEGRLAEKTALYDQTVMELNSEIDHLKEELETNKSLKEELIEKDKSNAKVLSDFESEMHCIQQELEMAKVFKEKFVQKEEAYEQLNVELEAVRMAESYALNLLDEWKRRSEELENKVAESNRLERSASESLESIMKQLEGNSDLLHEAECDISALKEKVSLLEISLEKKKEDLEESEHRLQKANEEAREAIEKMELLRIELESMTEEKSQALENERLAASSVQDLLEEKNKLINELDILKEEEEKSKKAMESLASALHEVSAESREAKERLLSSLAEHEYFETQIEHLQLVLKATSEKYEAMLEDSKREIDQLTRTVEQSKIDFDIQMEDLKVVLKVSNDRYESMLDESKQEIERLLKDKEQSAIELQNGKAEWEVEERELKNHIKTLEEERSTIELKEQQLVSSLKLSEEEKSSMEKEIMRLVHLLRESEEKASSAQEEGTQLRSSLREAMALSSSLKESRDEVESESLKLKNGLRVKENELQNMIRENEQLRAAEEVNALKIDELTKLLEEAKSYQRTQENGELSDSDKDYDMLPKVVEFYEENGYTGENKPKFELLPHQNKGGEIREKQLSPGISNGMCEGTKTGVLTEVENLNGRFTLSENKEQAHDESTQQSEARMWESYKVDKDFSTEMETEQGSLDDEIDSKTELAESVDQMNEINSDSKQKKKKPLYRKFGNLLKKGIGN